MGRSQEAVRSKAWKAGLLQKRSPIALLDPVQMHHE
jgi:hypothetical protein